MKHILAVTGTKREATVLRGLGVEALAIGGSPTALDNALADMGGTLAAVVSFGMAGALGPELQLGDWVIGTGLAGKPDAACDVAWAEVLAARLPHSSLGTIHADGRLIADPAEKRALYLSTGALAADMESHLAARAAAKAGVPLAIMRCISDVAESALPPAIAVAMHPDGRLALGAVLKSIVKNPLQLPDLFKTILCFNRAYLDMQSGVEAIGPRLAFDRR